MVNKLICSDTPATCDHARSQNFSLVQETTLFEAACAAGLKLAAKLGDGWSARVWENLGWHYEAWSPNGRIRVNEYQTFDPTQKAKLEPRYSASIHRRPYEAGSPLPGQSARTPQAAIVKAKDALRHEVKTWTDMLEGL